ncbi:T9SS type A sorting domain-containing protein [Dyadobacter flavalbus]|uniref:T9SS type A sorting domain-containing protein n=1 Tax=Dyadobacter flavalbus TaxID=2579942 RepID=A0A5M8QSA9_9BACT|nr:T9SS type A sorting domain-containing protein [Dyadobacter flavalbus]KAA6438969.1 T9SS type A sorting domain-containing protein [Dyadobacter flavalbus]
MKKTLRFHPSFSNCRNMLLCLLMFTTGVQSLFAQSDQLLLRDDFNGNSLSKSWKADENWSVLNGAAYNPFDAGSLLTAEKYTAESYVIETAAMGLNGSYWREFRLTFGRANTSEQKAYVLSYSPDTGGRLVLGLATDNIYHPEVLDEISIYPELTKTQWYKFKIARYKNGLIQVFLNRGAGYRSKPDLETIDLTYRQLGHFGWMVSTQTASDKFYVDWMEVRVPQTIKPPVPEKPEEDNLITQVSDANDKSYNVTKLCTGSNIYTDRDFRITSAPSYLQGASFIQTAMQDKNETQTSWLTTFIKKSAIVYIAYDKKAAALPGWLQSWHKTEDVIRTTDPNSNTLEIYSKLVDYWHLYPQPFILGANMEAPAEGAKSNYLVFAVPQPEIQNLEAEDAKISGAQIEKHHSGYSGKGYVDFINPKQEYIEWTIRTQLPGTYTLGFQFSNGSKDARSMRLTADNELVEISAFLPVYSWNNWAFYSGAKVYLEPGTHKIRLTSIGSSGPNMDYLSVSFRSEHPELPRANSLARNGEKEAETINQDAARINSAADFPAVAYPNPFQQNTTVFYQLPETNMVNLTLYTIHGQKQAVLVDQIQAAGKYHVEINGSNLAAGTYIYHLKQGNTFSFGKIVKQ